MITRSSFFPTARSGSFSLPVAGRLEKTFLDDQHAGALVLIAFFFLHRLTEARLPHLTDAWCFLSPKDEGVPCLCLSGPSSSFGGFWTGAPPPPRWIRIRPRYACVVILSLLFSSTRAHPFSRLKVKMSL